MNNNRCIWCQEIIPEGRDYCPTCEVGEVLPTTDSVSFKELKCTMWKIISREGIEITNQNIDWLLERAFKEMTK